LILISCEHTINAEKFKSLCLYSWYPMSPTIHKILVHGYQIINQFIVPLGVLGENASEARNVAGDWNASHWLWRAGRCNRRGYIDFGVTSGILDIHAVIRSADKLSSDHLPLIITLDVTATTYPWNDFMRTCIRR